MRFGFFMLSTLVMPCIYLRKPHFSSDATIPRFLRWIRRKRDPSVRKTASESSGDCSNREIRSGTPLWTEQQQLQRTTRRATWESTLPMPTIPLPKEVKSPEPTLSHLPNFNTYFLWKIWPPFAVLNHNPIQSACWYVFSITSDA